MPRTRRIRKKRGGNKDDDDMKKLYPRLNLSFEKAKEWLIQHLASDDFKAREDSGDTISSVPILQEIVRYNMITENSQEGIISKGFNEHSKEFYVIKERAYLSGFMKHPAALKLVNYLNIYTDKVAFITMIVPTEVEDYLRATKGNIAVTVEASAKSAERVTNFTTASVAQQFIDESGLTFMKGSLNIHEDVEVDLVMCFDPQYGRLASSKDGLYADVLKGLKFNFR